jgi:ABC-2 type transport system permease protein
MNKTISIFKHEFRRTIRRTGFIILTLALPVLALLGIGIYHVAAGAIRPPAEVTKIGYVDELGGLDQFTSQGNLNLVRYDNPEAARQALLSKDVTDYFVVPGDFIATGKIDLFNTKKELAPDTGTVAVIDNFISSNLLAGKVPPDLAIRVQSPLNVTLTTLTSTGAVAPQQGYANFIIPGVFSFLLALSLIFSSTYVLQSLGEEKESRLMEVLMSSISTRQLLTGKVLGLGAAGLCQVMVWIISFPLLLLLASSFLGGLFSTLHVPASFWILGLVYFILGYSLFAVLSAGVAAITSSIQEAQGLAGLYSMFSVAPFWFISLLLLFPNSPVWVVFSIFPFTSPVLVMMRLGLTGVPGWQVAVSMIVLALSVFGGLLLDARLLRTYMLMYGKRPGLGQLLRALRSS